MAKECAFGGKLQWNNATVWTDVANVRTIGDISIFKEFADTTTHDSPSRFREYKSTLQDTDPVEIALLFDPANAGHQHFVTNAQTLGTESFRIVLADTGSDTWAFTGEVERFSVSAQEVDGLLEGSITIRRTTGAVTITT